MKCRNCGNELNEREKFCPNCGVEAGPIKCPKCGAELNGEEKFCSKCGHDLEDTLYDLKNSVMEKSSGFKSSLSKSFSNFKKNEKVINFSNSVKEKSEDFKKRDDVIDFSNVVKEKKTNLEDSIFNDNEDSTKIIWTNEFNDQMLNDNGIGGSDKSEFQHFFRRKGLNYRQDLVTYDLIKEFLDKNPELIYRIEEYGKQNPVNKKYVKIPLDYNIQLLKYNNLDYKSEFKEFLMRKGLDRNNDLITMEMIDEFFKANPVLKSDSFKQRNNNLFYFYGYNEYLLKINFLNDEEIKSFRSFAECEGGDFEMEPISQSLIDEYILADKELKDNIKVRKSQFDKQKRIESEIKSQKDRNEEGRKVDVVDDSKKVVEKKPQTSSNCPKCGERNKSTSKFCFKCGAKLS